MHVVLAWLINNLIMKKQSVLTWDGVGFVQVWLEPEAIPRAVFVVFGIIGAWCGRLERLGVLGAARHRVPGRVRSDLVVNLVGVWSCGKSPWSLV